MSLILDSIMSLPKCYKPVTYKRAASSDLLKYANDTRSEGHFNDVTITIENECIPANKMVLSCHSVFFEKMFKCEMKEKYENKVEIESVDGKAVKSLIDYMYNGNIDIDDRNVFELLAAADYLQLMGVKQYCFQYLQSNVTINNWLYTLKAVNLFAGDKIKHQIYLYISTHFNEIVQTDDFNMLSNDDLKKLISYFKRTDVLATSLSRGIVTWVKHDVEGRKHHFLGLFKLIEVDQLSYEFIEDLSKENFVQTNFDCHQFLVTSLLQLLKNQGDEKKKSRVISVGGKRTLSKVTEVYNIHNCNLTDYPDFPINIACHSLLAGNGGNIFCIGGFDGDDLKFHTNHTVWLSNVKDRFEIWVKVSLMNERRCVMGATEHDGKLVVAGGYNGSDTLASAEFYDMSYDKWEQIASLIQNRHSNALVSCRGSLYALGGIDNSGAHLSSVERLKSLKGEWTESPSMLQPRKLLAAVNCSNVLYAIGGQASIDCSTRTSTVEKFDPNENKWVYVSKMNSERCAHAACVMQGKIYIVGGVDAKNEFIKTIECYNPSLDSWSIVGQTHLNLKHHAVVAL